MAEFRDTAPLTCLFYLQRSLGIYNKAKRSDTVMRGKKTGKQVKKVNSNLSAMATTLGRDRSK